MKSPLQFFSVCCLLVSGSIAPAWAIDRYVTVAGAGVMDGSSWSNALPADSLTSVINTTSAPGDIIYLGGPETAGAPHYGDRRFTITSSGTAAARKQLVGVDRGFGLPLFLGAQQTRSYTTITFGDTCSYWTVKNLRIEHRETGVATSGLSHVGLVIDGVTVRDTSSKCFSFTDCDEILVQNCRSERYNKKGFMFNHSCDQVTVKNSVADCTGTGSVPDEPWRKRSSDPVGFDFHVKGSTSPPNTNILLENCEALNNDEDTDSITDYEQGDGFKMEGSNDGVTLKRCLSHHNQDAAFDLKGANQILNDCIAIHNSRYGFKLWYSGIMSNCIAVSNGARQFTLPATTAGNVITATLCTFHGATNTQAGVVIETGGNTAVLQNCVISYAGTAGSYAAGPGTFVLDGTVKHANAANPANNPRYVDPTLPWDGAGNHFDNQTYGLAKGYNSTVMTAGAIVSVNLANSTANVLAPNEVVGAVEALNWNNSTLNNEVLPNVADDAGNPTPINISFSSTAFGYANNTGTLAAPMDDDAKMMRSTRALSNSGVMAAVADQILFETYDVYVYWGGQTGSESVPAVMTVELQLDSGGTWQTLETRYIRDTNRVWDGTYEESTATSAAEAVDGQEFVVFRNLTSPSFRIRSTCGVRAGISGFQIVEH